MSAWQDDLRAREAARSLFLARCGEQPCQLPLRVYDRPDRAIVGVFSRDVSPAATPEKPWRMTYLETTPAGTVPTGHIGPASFLAIVKMLDMGDQPDYAAAELPKEPR